MNKARGRQLCPDAEQGVATSSRGGSGPATGGRLDGREPGLHPWQSSDAGKSACAHPPRASGWGPSTQ